MHETLEQLPKYLRKYCVEQSGDNYTPRDHASWRYIMRQNRAFFKDHAVPIYLEGLKRTGITLDRIPLISEMDAKLKKLGWGAVPVRGFIPPAAFLDFQARKILPIAADMRSLDHIHYTPAPDIVHEAAGHAPIIADPEYSHYLTLYAQMAQRAIFCAEDLQLYEAIRTLSDVKENPDCTPEMIKQAEANLEVASNNVRFISEANKVARMNWWTVEYGLLGSLEKPLIYGAGLLSSVGESQTCLSPRVKKLRLSVACVETSYDITEPQPQLFVAEDIKHLTDVLKEFEATLSYTRGGIYGLTQAKLGRTVTTTVLDSGIQISGQLESFEQGSDERVEFLRFFGPVQLAYADEELPGQGIAQHPHGFSTPLGRAIDRPDTPLSQLDDAALERLGLEPGKRLRLVLTTGFVIEGRVVTRERLGGKLALIKWQDCRVTRGDQVYFQPDWGDFDMAVGESVPSVFGGPADRESYGTHDVGNPTTSPTRTSPYTPEERAAFAVYADIRQRRMDTSNLSKEGTLKLAQEVRQRFPREWLLRLEAIELLLRIPGVDENTPEVRELIESLRTDAQEMGADAQWLVQQGLELVHQAD